MAKSALIDFFQVHRARYFNHKRCNAAAGAMPFGYQWIRPFH
jgi:hypothetical protein